MTYTISKNDLSTSPPSLPSSHPPPPRHPAIAPPQTGPARSHCARKWGIESRAAISRVRRTMPVAPPRKGDAKRRLLFPGPLVPANCVRARPAPAGLKNGSRRKIGLLFECARLFCAATRALTRFLRSSAAGLYLCGGYFYV